MNDKDKKYIDKKEEEYNGKFMTYKRELKIILDALELKERGIKSKDINIDE